MASCLGCLRVVLIIPWLGCLRFVLIILWLGCLRVLLIIPSKICLIFKLNISFVYLAKLDLICLIIQKNNFYPQKMLFSFHTNEEKTMSLLTKQKQQEEDCLSWPKSIIKTPTNLVRNHLAKVNIGRMQI